MGARIFVACLLVVAGSVRGQVADELAARSELLEARYGELVAAELAAKEAETAARDASEGCKTEQRKLDREVRELTKKVFGLTQAVHSIVIPTKVEFGFADNSAAVERAEARKEAAEDRLRDGQKDLRKAEEAQRKKRIECTRLASQVEQARARVSIAVTARRALERELAEVKRALGQAFEAARTGGGGGGGPTLGELGTEVAALKGEIAAAEIALGQAEREKGQCRADLAALDARIAEIDRLIPSTQKQLADLPSHLDGGPKAHSIFERRQELNERLSKLRAERQLKVGERNTLAQLCLARDQAAASEAARKTALETARLEAEAALKAFQARPPDEQGGGSVADAESFHEVYLEGLGEAREAEARAKAASDTCDARTKKLEADIASLGRSIDTWRERAKKGKPEAKAEANRRAKELNQQRTELQAELARLRRDCAGVLDELKIARAKAAAAAEQVALAAAEIEAAKVREAIARHEAERAERVAHATKVEPMMDRYHALLRRISALGAKTRPRMPTELAAVRELQKEAIAISLEIDRLDRDAKSQRDRYGQTVGWSDEELGQKAPTQLAMDHLSRELKNVRTAIDRWLLMTDERTAAGEVLDMISTGVQVGVSAGMTRYERAKQWLTEAVRAYVSGNVAVFMDSFGTFNEIDLGILRNAVLDDFQRETEIRLDIELLSYSFGYDDDLNLSLRWNRSGIDKTTGTVRVENGLSLLVFSRFGDYRIKGWRISMPFGRKDQALRGQIRAGQLNDQTGIPSLVPVPVTRTFVIPSGIFIDFEGGSARPFVGLPPPPQAGEDVRVDRVFLSEFKVQVLAGPPAGVVACLPAPAALLDLRVVDESAMLPSAQVAASRSLYGIQTADQNFAFLEVRVEPNPENVTVTWITSPSPVVNETGTVDCP